MIYAGWTDNTAKSMTSKQFEVLKCDQIWTSLLNLVYQLPQLVSLAVIKELIKAKFGLTWRRAHSQNLNSEWKKKILLDLKP